MLQLAVTTAGAIAPASIQLPWAKPESIPETSATIRRSRWRSRDRTHQLGERLDQLSDLPQVDPSWLGNSSFFGGFRSQLVDRLAVVLEVVEAIAHVQASLGQGGRLLGRLEKQQVRG
jgi:hypothetical protein